MVKGILCCDTFLGVVGEKPVQQIEATVGEVGEPFTKVVVGLFCKGHLWGSKYTHVTIHASRDVLLPPMYMCVFMEDVYSLIHISVHNVVKYSKMNKWKTYA